MTFKRVGVLAIGALTGLALFMGACGGYEVAGDAATPEPTKTTLRSGSPTAEATSATTPTPPPAPATPTLPPAPATPAELTLVAESVQFKQRSLAASAGPVTIAFENHDNGIPHNVHVFVGGDASGASVGSTEIETGAVQQTLELGDLAPGSYFYQCDVHPSQMMGTLTVS